MSGIAAHLRRGCGDPLGDNDHAPVFAAVFAGGERDQLVVVFCRNAGVVKRKRLALSDIGVKVLRRLRTGEVVILEALLGIGNGLEHRHDLIFTKAGQRIEANGLVLLIKVLTFIFAEIGKHRSVVHVVAVDHAVVGQRKIAVFLHIGHAVIAVLLVKAPFQIVIRLAHGLHHGIVNVRAGKRYDLPFYKKTSIADP